ncbi:MAG: A24 family peptidase [Syntrophomonas sp.]
MHYLQYVILAVFLAVALFYDARESRIPNYLAVAGLAAGLVFNLTAQGMAGLLFALKGFAVAFIIMLLVYWLGGVGAGDVKLYGAIGAIMGTIFAISSLLYATVCAAIIGIFLVAVKGELLSRLKKLWFSFLCMISFGKVKYIQDLKTADSFRFPFMYAVIPGTVIAYFYPILF